MKIWKKWSKTAAMLMVASACMFTGMSTTAFANVDEAAVAEAEQQAAQNEQAAVQPEAKPPETETKPEAEGEKDKPFSVPGNGEVLDQITDGSSKEFYTIRTANNQTFYLVIDHAQNTDNVYMLSTIDENDLQEFTTGGGMTEKPEEKPPVIMEEPQTPTPEPEVQKPEETEKPAANVSAMILIIVAAVGGIAAYYFLKIKFFSIAVNNRKNFFFFDCIYFIYNKNYRCFYFFKSFNNMLFSRTDICCRLNKPAYNINFADCLFCCSNHIFTKFIFCLVNTGCINKYNLSSFICMDCLYSVSCRLRLIRRNGNFLTYHTVHKC